MAKNNYYAVKVGVRPGIYQTWAECQNQVKGFSGAQFKGFPTLEEAKAYLAETQSPKVVQKLDVPTELEATQKWSTVPGAMVAYVDGSYHNGSYSYGMVIVSNNKITFEKYGVGTDKEAAQMNNVAGEILGAQEAVRYALDKKVTQLVIFHDYQGISSWATGEWRAKNQHTLAYQQFMNEHKNEIDIEFVKVKGHRGNPFNEAVDQLAKKALGI